MSVTTAPATPPKSCGACMLCCKLLDIAEISKPGNQWCPKARPGSGCSIHGAHPQTCRTFLCDWTRNPALGEEWRPSRAKFLITADENGRSAKVVVDPAHPRAWRDPRYYPTLKQASGALRDRGGYLMVIVGKDFWVVVPEGDIRIGAFEAGGSFEVKYAGPGTARPYAEVTLASGEELRILPEGAAA
jgi:hypothetical protein